MPRLIFINRFYWPEEPATSQLLTDLAQGLATRGHEISVITSRPNANAAPRHEYHNGVSIYRIGSSRWGRKSLLGRVADFSSFILGTGAKLLTYPKRGDTVIFLTDPPLLAALLWPLLSARKVSFFHWVQDIYPEIACELTQQRWLKILIPWRNLSWRRARHCVTLGKDMRQVLITGRVSSNRSSIISNWPPQGVRPPADPKDVEQLKLDWKLEGKFIALYSGNLGRVHDLTPIMKAAAEFNAEDNISFVFIGDGAQADSLREYAASHGLDHVHFHPSQPRESLNTTLSLGDVHFVSLRSGCEGFVYPSKLYGIFAVSKPTIFIGPKSSGIAQTIENEQLGECFTPNDSTGIAASLRRMTGDLGLRQRYIENTAKFALTHDFAHALDSWHELINRERSLAVNVRPPTLN